MRRIHNIRLKNIPDARAKAILAIKEEVRLPLKECKDIVDKLLDLKEIEAEYLGCEWGHHRYEYNFIGIDGFPEAFERIIKQAFDCEIERVDRPSNENIREPDEATKKALAWLETLSEDEKEMVKLIGDWEHPICVAVC